MKQPINLEMIPIHAWVYDPQTSLMGKRSHKAQLNVLSCSQTDKCELYKRGQCVQHIQKGFCHISCPYGQRTAKTGYTPRASKYRRWINDRLDEFSESQKAGINQAAKQATRVIDYVFFPYGCIAWKIEDDTFMLEREVYGFHGTPFIPIEHWTAQNIIKILEYIPVSGLFSQPIPRYQKEEVPKIVADLKCNFPNLYQEVADLYPRILELGSDTNRVGSKVLLSSLKPGPVKHKDTMWHWDGKHLQSTEFVPLFMPSSGSEHSVSYKPNEDAAIVIHDNNQIDSETIFVG